jgi:soluble lytic murein transglycosylase-like protein
MARISQAELDRLRSSVWPALERDNALPAGILNAVATWETRGTFENDAVSGAGAQGIFQLTQIALRQIKKDTGMTINPRNIYEASKGAAFLLKRLGRLFAGHLALVLAAYNAGEGTIRRYMVSVRDTGSGFLPRETTDYIVNVSRLVRA